MKYKIGQKVKIKADGEIGTVSAISVTADGIRYQVSSREVDLQKKELIDGYKTVLEDELTSSKESKEEHEQ